MALYFIRNNGSRNKWPIKLNWLAHFYLYFETKRKIKQTNRSKIVSKHANCIEVKLLFFFL